MIINGQSGLEPVSIKDVTALIVSSDQGVPLALLCEFLPGRFTIKTIVDADFERTLNALGYDADSFRVNTISGPQISELD